jgi:hypothetical protein
MEESTSLRTEVPSIESSGSIFALSHLALQAKCIYSFYEYVLRSSDFLNVLPKVVNVLLIIGNSTH